MKIIILFLIIIENIRRITKVHPKGIPPKKIQKILLDLSNSFKKLSKC